MPEQKKSQRFETVRNLAETEADRLANELSAAQQAWQSQHTKLEELRAYCREYATGHQSGQLMDLAALQSTQHFVDQLRRAIAMQEATVTRLAGERDAARKAWMKARKHALSMETLVDRYQREEKREAERQEQVRSDDLVNQRFVWSQQSA